jgi:hypothetical protein
VAWARPGVSWSAPNGRGGVVWQWIGGALVIRPVGILGASLGGLTGCPQAWGGGIARTGPAQRSAASLSVRSGRGDTESPLSGTGGVGERARRNREGTETEQYQ